MNIATKANVRTTQAARTSLSKALRVSFTGGTVMGLGVAGLAVFGLGSLFIIFNFLYSGVVDGFVDQHKMEIALEVLAGFSLGAESVRYLQELGRDIYKVDVGADLVGKVEAGIPEDDPRNPATIADNVGDNVGDVAGMGADLFGSYVATILATMVLGREIQIFDADFNSCLKTECLNVNFILLPMIIAGLGLIFYSWFFFVRIKKESGSVQNALNIGNWLSIILTLIASYFVVSCMLPDGYFSMREDLSVLSVDSDSVFLKWVLLGYFYRACWWLNVNYY